MGTSAKMIEEHYGHITLIKNADRILLGLPGWQSATGGYGSDRPLIERFVGEGRGRTDASFG
jgi:hypothetical protein